MKTKILEIRDEKTFFAVVCVDMNPEDYYGQHPDPQDNEEAKLRQKAQRYYLRRCGYPCDGRPNILMTDVNAGGGKAWNDPYGWGGRTRPIAHNYIIENWTKLVDGDVVDVEYILGETPAPKKSERLTVPL